MGGHSALGTGNLQDRAAKEEQVVCSKGVGKWGVLMGVGEETKDMSCVKRAVMLLQRYFTGERVSFDLPLDLRYYTRFQQAVWKAAAEIPYGGTRSYAWIAKRIRKPLAARAVGQAMGANPVPIIIP
jgi:O6-methylguanine-DNA--protein-cysteine methyltransferase